MVSLAKDKQSEEIEKEVKKRLDKQLFEKSKVLGTEFKKQATTAIIAAFGLVIALSWQAVIKKVVDNLPKTGILLYHPYLAEVYTAVTVTIFCVLGILIISRRSN